MSKTSDPAAWVRSVVEAFCEGTENTLYPAGATGERAWAEPLVGFSSGADSLFEQYKEYVGPFHWTPLEVFSLTFPEVDIRPEELTVICWVLPQTADTKRDNRAQTVYPAERWARSRIFGEQVNNKLRAHVAGALNEAGYEAIAPMLSPDWKSRTSERFVYASTWSERHAAYASGLGTFGLCDGLITPLGKAMRVGSVVARIQIPPTPRPYTDHRAYCLFFSGGICGKCIDRCPVGALSKEGHDKLKCRAHLNPTTSEYVKANYGFDGYGCGLCQTAVPCESKIPTARDVEEHR
jgi:epoxyqueuosine reductase QueG